MRPHPVILAAAIALSVVMGGNKGVAGEPVTVFAAASLTDAMEAAGKAYQSKTGDVVRFSFAASSTLARQIQAGAPADIYASADRRWMDCLDTRGLIDAGTRTSPIANRLVLIAPAPARTPPVIIDRNFDLRALLGSDGWLAVGDPDHVPAGIYAREALTTLGLWDTVRHRLARADNVRAALALVARGEAPLGIVYATDARVSKAVKVIGRFPPSSHTPIRYPFAILKGRARPAVATLFAYLTGPEAITIFEDFGFAQVGKTE